MDQEKVPGSLTTGADTGAVITAPAPSQHGAADPHGSQAGAQAGAPHGGAAMGAGSRRLKRPQPLP
jgi:hypothetical protein